MLPGRASLGATRRSRGESYSEVVTSTRAEASTVSIKPTLSRAARMVLGMLALALVAPLVFFTWLTLALGDPLGVRSSVR